jgi:hypothetical protein
MQSNQTILLMYKLFCQDVWKKAIFSYFSDVEKNNAAKFQFYFYFTFAKNKWGGIRNPKYKIGVALRNVRKKCKINVTTIIYRYICIENNCYL